MDREARTAAPGVSAHRDPAGLRAVRDPPDGRGTFRAAARLIGTEKAGTPAIAVVPPGAPTVARVPLTGTPLTVQEPFEASPGPAAPVSPPRPARVDDAGTRRLLPSPVTARPAAQRRPGRRGQPAATKRPPSGPRTPHALAAPGAAVPRPPLPCRCPAIPSDPQRSPRHSSRCGELPLRSHRPESGPGGNQAAAGRTARPSSAA